MKTKLTDSNRDSGAKPRVKRRAAERKIVAVDLFCGAGGLTKGLLSAGVDVRLGIDLDKACQHPYESNNAGTKFILSDITKITPADLADAWKGADVKLLAGCAPCQPFSSYTQGHAWKRRDQWSLLLSFSALVKKCKPDLVTMENVPSLARHDVFVEFLESLEDHGYHTVWKVLDCRNYGIPQSRKRLVLIASQLGIPELPKPTHPDPKKWNTVRGAIGTLPSIKAGEAHGSDPLHISK